MPATPPQPASPTARIPDNALMSLESFRDPATPPLPDRERGPGGEGAHRRAIDELLARYGWQRAGEPARVPNSVLNTNYRVESIGGTLFVRAHKKSRTRERLEREHEVIRWVAERGIPANPPLADGEGRSLHSISGELFAVFPWLDGVTRLPGPDELPGVELFGELHGQLHAVLRDYPLAGLPIGGTGSTWDTAASIDMLGRVDDLIRYYAAPGPALLVAQDALREQLALLESGVARPASDFDALARQPCHGDYHERNVLLSPGGGVLAVVDWELVGLLPPVYEVLRAMTFMKCLDDARLDAYLRGYARHARIAPDDWGPGVELWWQSTLHDTWVFRARFIEGNLAVERFIPEKLPLLRRFADAHYRAELAARLKAASG
jgi:Ser/Thr protein kinase RdoA (MazF antagonist)